MPTPASPPVPEQTNPGGAAVGSAAIDDQTAMRLALAEALAAQDHADVPVGAVIVRDGVVIAARHNERELTGDPTAHAEILAIRDAAAVVGHWRLDDCTLHVTLEPCPMCAGAAVNARVGRVSYGADDPKAGAGGSLLDILADPRLNHRCVVSRGTLASDSSRLLKAFFAARRRAGLSAAATDAVDEAS
jgi:tRNA(adenine34) deaminase